MKIHFYASFKSFNSYTQVINSLNFCIQSERRVNFFFYYFIWAFRGLLGGTSGKKKKKMHAYAGDIKKRRFNPQVGKTLWRRAQQPTPLFLPGESHGHRSLEGYSPEGRKESDMTERLSTHAQCLCDLSMLLCQQFILIG